LEHLDALTPDEQEEVTEQILSFAAGHIEAPGARALRLAGAWADLPDDMEDTLLRWRREVPPTPLIEDLAAERDDTNNTDNT
jgi:hypothetical protein